MTGPDSADVLRNGFSGQVLVAGDAGYDEARRVFNGMIDRFPTLIARCANTADVVRALEVAREHAMVVAVRCGGHSVTGLSTCDDGMVIDLGGLKKITVHPEARTATAGGGVLWGEFDAATQAHGLHCPGGRVTTTGVGGFTTGGGYGWASSKHGLACDNLISAEVVLADGSVVRASETEHSDLFWAIRGGGGNFGVVTEFEFRLHPLGPMVLAGLLMFPLERASAVVRSWRDAADAAPDELATGCVLLTAPPEPSVPAELRGKTVVGVAALYVGDALAGAAVMQPFKDLGPAVDHIATMPYTAFQAALDPMAPWGVRSYWRGEYMSELTDAAIDTFLREGTELTRRSPLSQMILFRIGQGVTAIPDEAMAFSHRDAGYLFHPIVVWTDPADDERLIAAGRAFAAAMRPHTTGASYLNFTPEADRVRDAYGDEKYSRLVALKDRYDPANLFRLNQNIRPSQPTVEPVLT
ncbi:MAG: FAD-binding oxidoreductase [Candidatus Dormibacteria bacterium]